MKLLAILSYNLNCREFLISAGLEKLSINQSEESDNDDTATTNSSAGNKIKNIVAEIVHLPFSIKKRTEFGKQLGLTSITLHDIELQAMEKTNTKETALTEIINFWFDMNQSASYATIVDILENKMGMSLADAYEKRMQEDAVSQLGSCVEEAEIEEILNQLGESIPEFVTQLVMQRSTDDDRAELQAFLKNWIKSRKQDATWNMLLRKLEAIDVEAAKKIKLMRCPDIGYQDQNHEVYIMFHTFN